MTPTTEKVQPIPIEDEMRQSYLDYAMSVIVARALPDVRDGLKPVHRRILYAMRQAGQTHDKPFKKSATIVGEVIGKYHPHGDVAVYDTLVRMAQDFNMRYILVEGHGNFGSVDGDPPAAYRYTEARMSRLAGELLEDLDKETVNFRPNFDNSLKEPEVLPASLPNLLINGSAGIAVGMATNIPPHNLGEVIDGLVKLIEEPETDMEKLMKLIPAPDFPTGGLIMGLSGARKAFQEGRGSITIRGVTNIEDRKGKKLSIIISEIPYQVNKARLVEQIAEAVKSKRITGVSDLRDESDRRGMRIVIELQGNATPQLTLNQLYKHSDLQVNFGVNTLALVDGVPRVLNLKECLVHYLAHRKLVVTRRCEFDLRKAQERAHILEGLQIALDNLDAVIETIRKSQKVDEARAALCHRFKLSEAQAQAILEMRLQRLTGLERKKIQEEYASLIKTIAHLQDLLASERRIMFLIRDELLEMRKKYADPRKSRIVKHEAEDFVIEDLIPDEATVITISNSGYIKRMPEGTYRSQRRGGKGVVGMGLKEEDSLEHVLFTTTHQNLFFFTSRARVFRLKAYEIVEAAGRQAKGTAIVNLLRLESGEKVAAVIPIKDKDLGSEELFLIMATRQGMINKTAIAEYKNISRAGLIACVLKEDDGLVGVRLSSGDQEVFLISRNGQSIRFPEKIVRATGRRTKGVIGMRLRSGDEVVAMAHLETGSELLVVTANGYGKRTAHKEYRCQSRGGVGIKTLNVTKKTGQVVDAKVVEPEDELILTTAMGNLIRISVSGISTQGRATQGVTLIRLEEGDSVSDVGHLSRKDMAGEEQA